MAILLVDDNEISLELQKLMLESYGLTVDTAISGEQAIGLASEKIYSIIFMDIRMAPGMDGFAAAEKIRSFNRNVPIIALSADHIAKDDARFLQSGMSGALQKPLQLTALKTLLSSYIELAEDNHEQWRRKSDIIFDEEELSAVLGDGRAMKQILQQFLGSRGHDGETICALIDAGDVEKAREMLHELIGVAGNLYCCRLYESASRLNNELKSGLSGKNGSGQFIQVWQQTVGRLSECCNMLASKFKPEADSDADWNNLWKDFCDLCRDFDMMATNIFNRNISLFAVHLNAADFDRLKAAVNQYDYLSVLELLEGNHV